ncbi:sterol desaturase family protein [Erythrobacter rubeus]|uniref:Sterol desaturase family protein n=1 Tax=Erythrobacter rubeus TaxID=2760803 RepID=A0ABR8KRH8_9SPHN|nr:sterol desaturase family protein [Erythrobacter rubeus]MBD2841054.1 sterol desaturase family protein [Erythrobacter rubeus]
MKVPTAEEKRLIIFDNPLLEKMTVTSIGWFALIWATLLPLLVLAGWGTASPLAAAGLTAVGVLSWSLFEYIAHRHIFHWDPDWLPAKRMMFAIHGNHHVQPADHLRNLMPPVVSVPVGLLIWGLSYMVAGGAGTWFCLGFMSGYVAYDVTHYACHQWPMRGPIAKIVKQHHMRHHFVANNANFGVASIFWDKVFGTQIDSVAGRSHVAENADHLAEPAE